MYPGSSGCPGFTVNGDVVGMQSKVRNKEDDPSLSFAERSELDISLWVPSQDIVNFISNEGIIYHI